MHTTGDNNMSIIVLLVILKSILWLLMLIILGESNLLGNVRIRMDGTKLYPPFNCLSSLTNCFLLEIAKYSELL